MDLGLVILAGGHSSRMGHDKAFLPWQDSTLLTDLLQRSNETAFSERIISINRDYDTSLLPDHLKKSITTVADHWPNCGPLGGIEAALQRGTCNSFLVLSVDLPFYDFSPVQNLYSIFNTTSSLEAVIPVTDGKKQPLAALYRRSILSAVVAALQRHDYKLRHIYEKLAAFYADESSHALLYTNVNTPAAYRLAVGRNLNNHRRVPVITLTAPHSHLGKTTAAVSLIRQLSHLGFRVAFIKSTHHSHPSSKPGTDTDRAAKAGATTVHLCFTDKEKNKNQALMQLAQEQDADIVLMESRHHGPAPKLDVTQIPSSDLLSQVLFAAGLSS